MHDDGRHTTGGAFPSHAQTFRDEDGGSCTFPITSSGLRKSNGTEHRDGCHSRRVAAATATEGRRYYIRGIMFSVCVILLAPGILHSIPASIDETDGTVSLEDGGFRGIWKGWTGDGGGAVYIATSMDCGM